MAIRPSPVAVVLGKEVSNWVVHQLAWQVPVVFLTINHRNKWKRISVQNNLPIFPPVPVTFLRDSDTLSFDTNQHFNTTLNMWFREIFFYTTMNFFLISSLQPKCVLARVTQYHYQTHTYSRWCSTQLSSNRAENCYNWRITLVR